MQCRDRIGLGLYCEATRPRIPDPPELRPDRSRVRTVRLIACPSCHIQYDVSQILEKEVFTNTDVKHALEDYLLIKVDTDRYPEVAEYFKIRALPTLIAIDGNSVDRYRHVGLIGVTELVRDLANALRQQEGMD